MILSSLVDGTILFREPDGTPYSTQEIKLLIVENVY